MKFSDIFSFSRDTWQTEIVPFPTDLKNIKSMEILHIKSKKRVMLNKEDINNFLSFMYKGSCTKILKGFTRYQLNISHEDGLSKYYIYADGLGPEQGGLVQATFEPKKRGFEVFLHSFF